MASATDDKDSERWKQHIDPRLQKEIAVVADEQNAVAVWATLDATALEFESDNYPDNDATEEVDQYLTEYVWSARRVPSGEARGVLKDWLDSVRPHMEVIHAGMARGRAQALEGSDLYVVRSAVVVKLARAQLLSVEGHHAAACDEAKSCAALLDLLHDPDGTVFASLVSLARESPLTATVRCIAAQREVRTDELRRLRLAVIPRDAMARAWGNSLSIVASELLTIPAAATPEALAKLLTGELADGIRTDRRRNQIATLLRGHLRAFDKVATLRAFSALGKDILDNSGADWTSAAQGVGSDLIEHTADWPDSLLLEAMLWEEAFAADDGFVDAGSTDDGDDEELDEGELSPAELQTTRSSLRRIDNAVGKIYLRNLLSPEPYRALKLFCSARAQRAAARTTLALRLFEREHGRLPETLEQLVELDLLPTVPADPFGRGALGYSAEQRVLWSVGADGQGDGTRRSLTGPARDPENEQAWDQLVWYLPPLAN